MTAEDRDRFGRCIVCGRRGVCCEDCHRGYDALGNVPDPDPGCPPILAYHADPALDLAGVL